VTAGNVTKSVNNRKTENRNDPDLVQAFLKKWWVESDFKAPNLPLSVRLNVSGCHYNSIYYNTKALQITLLFFSIGGRVFDVILLSFN
jgi:hypothetical protein